MSAQGLENEMYTYFRQLSLPEKKSIVQLLKTFVTAEKKELVSIEEYNLEIDAAMAEIAAGKSFRQEEVKKMAEKW